MIDEDTLDDWLAELGGEHPSAALRERVLADAPRSRARSGSRLWWSMGGGWALAGVAGLVLGATLPTTPDAEIEQAFAIEDGVWPEEVG